MRQNYAINEIATKGERLYREQISKNISPTDRMKYLVIEVETKYPGGWFHFIRADGAASMTA